MSGLDLETKRRGHRLVMHVLNYGTNRPKTRCSTFHIVSRSRTIAVFSTYLERFLQELRYGHVTGLSGALLQEVTELVEFS